MNLHSNQIQFAGAEPVKVSYEHERNTVAEAAQGLSNAVMDFYVEKAKIDDIELAQKMDQASALGIQELQRYNPSDNNYEPARQEYFNRLNETLESASPSAQVRFARQNPMYMEKQAIVIDDKIFEKQQEFARAQIETLTPQLASNVVTGASDYTTERAKLEAMLAKTDNVYATKALFDFDKEVELGNINNLILAGRYQDAMALVNDPAQSPTLTASERISASAKIKSIIESDKKNKKDQKEAILKEIKDAQENEATNLLVDAALEDTNKYSEMRDAFISGEDIDIGGVKVNSSDLDFATRMSVVNKVDGWAEKIPQQRKVRTTVMNSAENLLVNYDMAASGENGTSLEQVIVDMADFVESPQAQFYLPETGEVSLRELNSRLNTALSAQEEAMGYRINLNKTLTTYDYIWTLPEVRKALGPIDNKEFKQRAQVFMANTKLSGQKLSDRQIAAGLAKIAEETGVADKGTSFWSALGSVLVGAYQGTIGGTVEEYTALSPLGSVKQHLLSFDSNEMPVSRRPYFTKIDWAKDATNAAAQYLGNMEIAMQTAKREIYDLLGDQAPKMGTMGDFLYSVHLYMVAGTDPLDANSEEYIKSLGLPPVTQRDLTWALNKTRTQLQREGVDDIMYDNSGDTVKLGAEVVGLYFKNLLNGEQKITDEQAQARAALSAISTKSMVYTGRGLKDINIVQHGPLHMAEPDELYGRGFRDKLQGKKKDK